MWHDDASASGLCGPPNVTPPLRGLPDSFNVSASCVSAFQVQRSAQLHLYQSSQASAVTSDGAPCQMHRLRSTGAREPRTLERRDDETTTSRPTPLNAVSS